MPSGLSTLWLGPATKPSSDIEILKRSFDKVNPSNWIFPKGHVDPGESHAAAALREAAEEGGIEGTVVGLVGTSSFSWGKRHPCGSSITSYMSADGPSPERRDKQWLTPESARAAVDFADARDLLDRAMPEIRLRRR